MSEIENIRAWTDSLVADTAELIAAGEIDGTEAVVILAHALAEVLAVADNPTDDLLAIWATLSEQIADTIRTRTPPAEFAA